MQKCNYVWDIIFIILPYTSELKAQEIAGPDIIYLTFLQIIYLAIRRVSVPQSDEHDPFQV